MAADEFSGGWTVQRNKDGTLQLLRGGVPQGTVALGPQVPGLDEGKPRCYCWLADAAGQPYAIAVGTDIQDSVYVCRLVERGPCPILRHFRGHSDRRDFGGRVAGPAIPGFRLGRRNRAVLEPGRLCPGRQAAGTLGSGLRGPRRTTRRGRSASGRPLVRQGNAQGRRARSRCAGPPTRRASPSAAPAAMLEKLQSLPWGTQIVFEYARNGAAATGLPTPAGVATAGHACSPTETGEWAFWTPARILRCLDERLSPLRLAGQSRPATPAGLLPRRSILQGTGAARRHGTTACRRAASTRPCGRRPCHSQSCPSMRSSSRKIAATPRVEILTPAAGIQIGENTRAGASPHRRARRLQAAGCQGLCQRGDRAQVANCISEQPTKEGKESVYEWELSLPSDPQGSD